MDDLQRDLVSAILRMEQAAEEDGTALGGLLLQRLATCDAVRLRQHVTAETWAEVEALGFSGDSPESVTGDS